MRRVRQTIALGVAAACAIGSSAVNAQADDEEPVILAVGTYEGSLNFTGGFILDIAQAIAESGESTAGVTITGAIDVNAAINGPATMVVAESGVTGDWSIAGTGDANGAFTGVIDGTTVTLEIMATSVYDGEGVFAGEPDNARLEGTFNGTTTATVTAPFGSQSATDTSSDELSITLTNPVGDCGRAFARVDLEITQRIEEVPGATSTAIGIFSAADPTAADELVFTESEILSDKISALWNRIQSPDELTLELMANAYQLLRDVEAFEDRLDPDSCGTDPDFANVMTLLTADLIDEVLRRSSTGDDLSDRLFFIKSSLELGLRSGALGSGTKIKARAMRIAAAAEAGLGALFNEATEGGDTRVLENTALLARRYGWTLTNNAGVTSDDVLLVLGVE